MKQSLLFLILIACMSTAHAQDGWKQIYQNRVAYYGVTNADSISVIDSGRVMLSADGGNTWQQTGTLPVLVNGPLSGGGSVTYQFYDLNMLSARDILFSGSLRENPPSSEGDLKGFLYQSTNAGATWRMLAYGSFVAPIRDLLKLSDTQVIGFGRSEWNSSERNWMLSPSFCVWTGDSIRLGAFEDSLAAASALSVVGDSVFVHVKDTIYRSDISLSEWQRVEHISMDYTVVESNVRVSGSMRSSDNGQTWTPTDTPFGLLFGSNFGLGWVVGEVLYKTTDAALTWKMIPFAPEFKSIVSIDTVTAFGYGKDRLLYRTSSGGWRLAVEKSRTTAREIFPNPAATFVSSVVEIEWYDLLGRSYSPPNEMIGDIYRYDISGLNAGAYMVRRGGITQIVIVQR